MCGLYAPTDGEMLVDGLDSRQYHPHQLREAFRFVGQDAELFSRHRARQSHAWRGAGPTTQQLIDAVVRSGADIFLSRDAAGFDRPVGERGSRLSGGQQSLLVLARRSGQPVEAAVPRRADRRDGHADRALFHRASEDRAGAGPDADRVDPSPQDAVDLDRLIVIDGGRIFADGPRDEVLGKLGQRGEEGGCEMSWLQLARTRLTPAFRCRPRHRSAPRRCRSARWCSRPIAADSMPLPAARAAALIQATSGDASTKVAAVGDEAKLINAAMPFSAAPVVAARAFVIPAGETLDQRRALLCLTQAVYYEAGYEPLEGRRAVAQVVLNRMRHPAFPKSVCGVVYQHNATPVCQFTFVCDGSLYRRPEAGRLEAGRAGRARPRWPAMSSASVGAATHYHADYVAPSWAPLLAKISKLGAHIFYRWPGAWGQPAAFTGRYIGEPRDPASLRPPLNLARLTDRTASRS